MDTDPPTCGILYIVGTPIGNLGDISQRAIECLRSVDLIACEDTRRTRGLLSHLAIPCPRDLISYRQGVEGHVGERLVAAMKGGESVALCSDGGYPGISDPGYRLIRLAISHDLEVQVIPGASAVAVALLLSGLPTSSYTFKGYPPRKPGPLRRFFDDESEMPHTLVLFESPYRIAKTLAAAYEVLGNREAAVCLELTKKFERVSRGYLADLAGEYDGVRTKGEATIVVAGNNPKFARGPEEESGLQ